MQRAVLRTIALAGKNRKNDRPKHCRSSFLATGYTSPPSRLSSQSTFFPAWQTICHVYSPIHLRHFSRGNSKDNKRESKTEPSAPTAVGLQEYDDNNNDDNENNSINDQQTCDDLDSVENEDTDAALSKGLVFRETLNNWYRANFDVSLNDAFQANLSTSNRLWSSCFICPVTGHRLEATVLPGETYRGGMFTSKKLANQAAAYQAVRFFCPIEGYSDGHFGTSIPQKRLQLIYMKEHKIILKNSDFAVDHLNRPGKENGGSWWTASFRCPITGESFPAMKLPSHERVLEDKGKIWYRRKDDAIEAACERALWVKENPLVEVISTEPLRLWYRDHHYLELTDDNFVVTNGSWEGSKGIVWTASFICPLTGNRYDSGRLEARPHISDEGFHWYNKKKDAIIAAALRAHDILKFQATGTNQPRFCLDDPDDDHPIPGTTTVIEDLSTANPIQRDIWNSLEEAAQPTTSLVTPQGGNVEPTFHDVKFNVHSLENDDEDFTLEFLPQKRSESRNAKDSGTEIALHRESEIQATEDSVIENGESEIHDDDDYEIEFVPRRGSEIQDPDNPLSTLDVVAQTWVHATQGIHHSSSVSPRDPRESSSRPQLNRKEAIQRARSWLAQQSEGNFHQTEARSRFDRISIHSSKTVAKRLLQSLALSNRTIVEDGKTGSGVETTAKQIIDFLWSSPDSIPDSDCYAFYIQCLEGNEQRVVKRAQSIYDAMSTGIEFEGHVMPPPNTLVLNSLIQRKADIGIRTSVSELEGIEVNRETFLSCLSAIAHSTGQRSTGFDSQYVLDHINEMKRRGAAIVDGSLQVDIAIYNAPMRWSCDPQQSLHSRPYSRPIPWDKVDKIFVSPQAFSDQDPKVKEAQAVENWFRTIEGRAFGATIRPNIETYESVIQAWIRTGTLKGLDYAEAILDMLLARQEDEVLTLRPQTFHPYIAASVFAGDYERVDRCMEKLRGNCHEILHDGRLAKAPIVARLVASNVPFARGDECLGLLRNLLDSAKSDENKDVDARAFMSTIDAFYKQAKENNGYGTVSNAISGIKQTVEVFDEFLRSCISSADGEHRSQILHLVQYAPLIYSSAFSALNGIESDGKSAILLSLPWLEKVVRRSGEHGVMFDQYRQSLLVPPLSDNRSPFNYDSALRETSCRTWEEYYSSLIDTIPGFHIHVPDQANELLGVVLLALRLARRSSSNDGEQTEPGGVSFARILSMNMQGESDSVVYTQSYDGAKYDQSGRVPRSSIMSDAHRRKRKEKSTKAPTRRPRNAPKEQRRESKHQAARQ